MMRVLQVAMIDKNVRIVIKWRLGKIKMWFGLDIEPIVLYICRML